jgi:hypothetical protein
MRELYLENFRKWMKDQQTQPDQEPVKSSESKSSGLIGLEVESKIPSKRLAKNVDAYDGDLHDLCVEFKTNGGKIKDVDGKTFLIEVNSGTFSIARCFVRKRD